MGRGDWVRLNVRPTVERHLDLDIRTLTRKGALRPGKRADVYWSLPAFEAGISVRLHEDGGIATIFYGTEGNAAVELVDVAWTVPFYGGSRPWWRCPDCGRRAAILYLADHFTCRLCAAGGLTYEMAQLSHHYRALRQYNRAATRLGWQLGLPFPTRPKGMHLTTWARRIDELARRAEDAMAPFVARTQAALQASSSTTSASVREP